MDNVEIDFHFHSIFDTKHLLREFFAGGIAGSIGIFIGFPFDLVKVKLQSNVTEYENAWSCVRSIVKTEGAGGLYKGCIPPTTTQGLINALLFVGESTAIKILEPGIQQGQIGSPVNNFLAGCCGGLLQCIALVPTDVIKCSMQAESNTVATVIKNSMSSSSTRNRRKVINFSTVAEDVRIFQKTTLYVKNIYASNGIKGFYKGFFVTAVREVPSIGLYFFSYKHLRESITAWQGLESPSTFATLIAGGCAGAISWCVVYPIDVVKTNIQLSQVSPMSAIGDVSIASSGYSRMSTLQVATHLYQTHGIRIFTRGFGTTVMRAFPVNASTFYFYELFKQKMGYIDEVE